MVSLQDSLWKNQLAINGRPLLLSTNFRTHSPILSTNYLSWARGLGSLAGDAIGGIAGDALGGIAGDLVGGAAGDLIGGSSLGDVAGGVAGQAAALAIGQASTVAGQTVSPQTSQIPLNVEISLV